MLLYPLEEWMTLNHRWGQQDIEQAWEARWKKIWGIDLTRRSKLFLWHIFMHSMYNMVCTQKLGHGDGCCPIFPSQLEYTEHIFLSCFKAQRIWAATAIFYEPDP